MVAPGAPPQQLFVPPQLLWRLPGTCGLTKSEHYSLLQKQQQQQQLRLWVL